MPPHWQTGTEQQRPGYSNMMTCVMQVCFLLSYWLHEGY
jgi:hypothetical protein